MEVPYSSKDIFNRLDTFRVDTAQTYVAQFNLKRAEFIAEHPGKVNHKIFWLTSADPSVPIGFLLNKIPKLFKIDDELTIYNNGGHVFWGEDFVANLYTRTILEEEYDDLEDEILLGYEDSVPEDESNFSEIVLHFCTINLKLLNKIPALFKKIGIIASTKEFIEKKDEVSVAFAQQSASGVSYRYSSFPKVPFDSIVQNYNKTVVEKTTALLEKIKNVEKGVIILHGTQGTGKTYLIRSLLTAVPERKGIVCSPASVFMSDSNILAQTAGAFRKSMIVLEDFGGLVSTEGRQMNQEGFSALLNFSEGLQSVLCNTIFIVSFNDDISNIDPAIRRPGRCLAEIEVGLLDKVQAEAIAGFSLKDGQYTLAQAYEMKNTGQFIEPEERAKESKPTPFRLPPKNKSY